MLNAHQVKEFSNDLEKNKHFIHSLFASVINEIEETKDDKNHLEIIKTYIQFIDHPLFAPLNEYSLWTFKRDYNAALAAAIKFHENAISTVKDKMYLFSVMNFEISIDIYKSLGKGHLDNLNNVIMDIFDTIKIIESNEDIRWNLEFLELLCNNWNSLEKETYDKTISIIETSFQHFSDIKNMNFARHYLEIKRKLVNKKGETKEINTVLERIAMTYEKEAEFKKEEPAVVCAFLEDAMKCYEKTGNKIKIDEIKLKLKEESKKIKYSKSSVDIEMPIEWIDNIISDLTTLEINEIPLYVGSNGSFIPQRKEVRRLADKILSDHPLLGIIATTANSDGNSVKSNSSEEELREYQYRHQYEFQIKYIGMVLSILFQKIFKKGLLNSENIYTYLSKNELFTPDDLKTAKIGFDAYFKADYISSLHILVPKLESMIRNIMQLVGITTTISDKDGIREGDLGSSLRKSEVEKMFGEDFNDFLKILLIEKDAINLRNRLAHGLLKYSEFNEVLASIIVFVYLRLGTLRLVDKKEED